MTYTKTCKHCQEYFSTDRKNAKICSICREKNHLAKINKTLFNGEVLFVTISG